MKFSALIFSMAVMTQAWANSPKLVGVEKTIEKTIEKTPRAENVCPSDLFLDAALGEALQSLQRKDLPLLKGLFAQPQRLHFIFDVLPNGYVGFFVRQKDKIYLDCSMIQSEGLESILAHELLHYHLRSENTLPFVEEMLAQDLQSEISEGFPKVAIDVLSRKAGMIQILQQERLFQSADDYAINFLFWKYLGLKGISKKHGDQLVRIQNLQQFNQFLIDNTFDQMDLEFALKEFLFYLIDSEPNYLSFWWPGFQGLVPVLTDVMSLALAPGALVRLNDSQNLRGYQHSGLVVVHHQGSLYLLNASLQPIRIAIEP